MNYTAFKGFFCGSFSVRFNWYLSLFVVIAAPASVQGSTPRKIEVQGHRGARAVMPENTLAAFRYALELGVETLELDTNVTKDGVVVVSHEQFITPELCVDSAGQKPAAPIAIRTLTLEQVKQYDCGSVPNPKFPRQKRIAGERIPTLREVFDLVKTSALPQAKRVQFNVEMKTVPALPGLDPGAKEFTRLLLKEIDAAGMASRTVVQCFNHLYLVEVKRQAPKQRVSALLAANFMLNVVGAAKKAGFEIISPHLGWVTREWVGELHAAGLQVIPWTANDSREWEYLLSAGVDGIISDDPEALIAFLKTKGLR
ncbi:MAG: glycerophosphodiester phosphodiesterase [Bacteriovoracia bacterium]